MSQVDFVRKHFRALRFGEMRRKADHTHICLSCKSTFQWNKPSQYSALFTHATAHEAYNPRLHASSNDELCVMSTEQILEAIADARVGTEVEYQFRVRETKHHPASNWKLQQGLVIYTSRNGSVTVGKSFESEEGYVLPHPDAEYSMVLLGECVLPEPSLSSVRFVPKKKSESCCKFTQVTLLQHDALVTVQDTKVKRSNKEETTKTIVCTTCLRPVGFHDRGKRQHEDTDEEMNEGKRFQQKTIRKPVEKPAKDFVDLSDFI